MFNTTSPQHLVTLVFIMFSYNGRRLECLKIYINMISNTFINFHEKWAQYKVCPQYALIVCVRISCFSHVHHFVILWIVAHQAPLSMGFSRQEYCSGLPFPSPGDLSDPGIEPRSPALQADSCIVGRFFTNWIMTEAQRDRKVLVFQEWGEDLSWCRMNLDTWRLGWS